MEVYEIEYEEVEFKEAKREKRGGKSVLIARFIDDYEDEIEFDATALKCEHLIAYLNKETTPLAIGSIDEQPITLKTPQFVECTVAQATPAANTRGTHKVTLDNGRQVQLPKHVKQGDRVIMRLPVEEFSQKIV
eukprot:CAMPEP_0201553996 /NCGR_PEP_ID=MMETSP0173_2-20130828/36555_1 /ASSEMBLY_ACC=CAM_ASM_000268 /TAXON_ID=218659 /ORGANISM="Vexillifera sp., Strain DIVA3 564/2" /LENGTH=133 /DNA_ID=CAMNT_0047965099 /DNA_START=30 /DNA_END=431 /DNA_ORIENTATION=-